MSAEGTWPRVGCGAAITRGAELLLVRRRRAPEAGCWGLPGGKVDPFERITDATAREIREELGIVIEATNLLCVVDQIDLVERHHWVAPVFLVTSFTGTPAIQEPDALSEWGWFALDALPSPLTQAIVQVLGAIKRTRA